VAGMSGACNRTVFHWLGGYVEADLIALRLY